MRAMLLAAGLGTRLGELSAERPKPLLPMADIPILRYGLALCRGHGIREVVINLHHHGEQIMAALADAEQAFGTTLRWSHEPVILGTGGGIRQAADWLTRGGQEPFLVMNGKLVTDIDLAAVQARHRASGAVATMVVREVPDAERWGAVDLDAEDRVLRIINKGGAGGEGPPVPVARRTMFTGVHVLSPRVVEYLPEGESCIIRQGYLRALADGLLVAGLRYDGYFQEHSTPERYLQGNFAVVRGAARLRHAPGPLQGVDPAAELGPAVRLVGAHRVAAGARVGAGAIVGPDVVVGAGAQVAPGVRLERVVIWPGAKVDGDVADAIVTPRGVFPVPGVI
ncbi:MAG TPA: NDP-sugar synthase [Polyangia bacterium]|jgi:NDP-sugar pyrophosphorylase family protein|nr:NDP-sugar synthase [Polyangia bacterium]